jgi:hypothetical protein
MVPLYLDKCPFLILSSLTVDGIILNVFLKVRLFQEKKEDIFQESGRVTGCPIKFSHQYL